MARAPRWAVQGYCHCAANPSLWNTHRQALGGSKSVLGMEMAGKAHLGPHGPGSGHIHRSPSPGVSPFHPRMGCSPRLVPLVIRMPPQSPHVNPSSHDTPPSACGDLVIPGGPCPRLAPALLQPLAGNSCVTHSPPKPLQGGAFPNPPLASPTPPTSPSAWRTSRPE